MWFQLDKLMRLNFGFLLAVSSKKKEIPKIYEASR